MRHGGRIASKTGYGMGNAGGMQNVVLYTFGIFYIF